MVSQLNGFLIGSLLSYKHDESCLTDKVHPHIVPNMENCLNMEPKNFANIDPLGLWAVILSFHSAL